MNSNHHITCLQSVITHQRKLYSYVDLCSCCCAATVIACFWSVCAASPEVLCYRYNGLIHNTQLVWARSLTSTLCSQFFELGLTSKKFLQEFLKSFKALFPPLSPLFLSLVITGECCIWFAFIPENKRVFFSRRKMQLWLRLCWGELGGLSQFVILGKESEHDATWWAADACDKCVISNVCALYALRGFSELTRVFSSPRCRQVKSKAAPPPHASHYSTLQSFPPHLHS